MSTFISKRKYGLVIISLIVFSFNLAVYASGFYEKGLNYLRSAQKRDNAPIKDSKTRRILENAYRAFKESRQKNARLLQVYTGQLLSKDDAIKPVAVQIVRNYRNRYIPMIAELEVLSMNEKKELKRYMLTIEEQIPYIKDIKSGKPSIYPFLGERPAIKFTLSNRATVQLKIDDSSESSRLFPGGTNTLSFKWKERYMDKRMLYLTLNASNDIATEKEEKELFLDFKMPHRLRYNNGKYQLEGEAFRKETKTVTRKQPRILLGGLLLGAVLGGLVYLVKESEETGGIFTQQERRQRGLITGGVIFGLSTILFLTTNIKKSVPHHENIRFNRNLKEQIEELKKRIRVSVRTNKEE
jgi:hypothetical protein